MGNYSFRNKRVWITGASSGIGEALAYQLVAEGADVFISARRREKLEEVKRKSSHPQCVTVVPMDIIDKDSVSEATTLVRRAGRLDLVILNAGIAQKGLASENPMEIDRKIMETNYFGTIAVAKEVLKIFIEQKIGWFAVVTSMAGVMGVPGRSAYSASKHALHGYFESLAAEEYDCDLKVSMILPGFINTNITVNELTSEGKKFGKVETSHAMGMAPDECAQRIISGLKKGKRTIVVGKFETISVYMMRYLPWLYAKVIRRHPMRKIRKVFKRNAVPE